VYKDKLIPAPQPVYNGKLNNTFSRSRSGNASLRSQRSNYSIATSTRSEQEKITGKSIDKVLEKLDWATSNLDDSKNVNHTIAMMNLIKSSSEAFAALKKIENIQEDY
jgi:hypothetical protein